jgi:hypothetical protein
MLNEPNEVTFKITSVFEILDIPFILGGSLPTGADHRSRWEYPVS